MAWHRVLLSILSMLPPLLTMFAPPALAQSASPQAIDIPKWFTETFLDFREDVADARRDGKRLMIYFGQDGCPYCKLLMQSTFTETRVVDRARSTVVPIALNLWGDREVTWTDGRRMPEKELGRLLGVQFTPTLLFFDEQGKVIGRLNGFQSPARMEAALDYVAQRMDGKQPFDAWMLRIAHAPPTKGGALIDQAFFMKPPYDMARSGKPLLVIFERPGCASCEELHREGFRRADVRKPLAQLAVARFDPAAHTELVTPAGQRSTASAWARELGIAYAPTLVFFDGGKEVFRVEAYVRPFHLASALDYVASGAYRKEPSFQRYVQTRADAQREQGKAVDLWK